MRIRVVLFTCFSLICFVQAFSQLDTLHYFPPFHASEHVNGEHYFYFSTPSEIPIDIEVLDNFGNLIDRLVISNDNPEAYLLGTDLTSKAMCITAELGRTLRDKGYIIRSNSRFYCNYRVLASPQSGSISCKGIRALGRRFRPGHLLNSMDHASLRSNTVSVFAVEDAIVEVSNLAPGLVLNNISIANNSFTVRLLKGETIVFTEYLSLWISNVPNGFLGSLIESSGDIVVNCGSYTGGNVLSSNSRDIGINQIVPMSEAGSEFICIRGNGLDLMENIILVFDTDNTKVEVNGVSQGSYNTGEYKVFDESFFSTNDNMYIKASEGIMVYQMLGGAPAFPTYSMNFIPALNCLGDTAVNNIPFYNRINNFSYDGNIIIVAKKDAPVFINNVAILGLLAKPVEGNPDYVSYKLTDNFNADHLAFKSDQAIQVGLIGANGAIGFSAYFSGFSLLPEVGFLGVEESNQICLDTLRASGNYNKIEWYLNDSLVATDVSSLVAKEGGAYFIVAQYDRCPEIQDTSFIYYAPVKDTVYVSTISCSPIDTGYFIRSYTNRLYCDSTVFETITLARIDTVENLHFVCNSSEVRIDTSYHLNEFDCDSIRIDRYSYVGVDTFIHEVSICEGDDYVFESRTLNLSGLFCVSFSSIYDCDSTHCLKLIVLPSYDTLMIDTICSDEFIVFEGDTLRETGLYHYPYSTEFRCDSNIQLDLHVIPQPSLSFSEIEPFCSGDSIILNVFIDDTLSFNWQDGHQVKERSFDQGGIYFYTYSIDFCMFNGQVEIPDPIILEMSLLDISDFSDFQVSCYGASDGFISVNAVNGVEPYLFTWSDSYIGAERNDLAADYYSITVTDHLGCIDSLEVILEEPTPLEIEYLLDNIDCYRDLGRIEITNIIGAVPVYQVILDNQEAIDNTWSGLEQGSYELLITDKNNCLFEQELSIINLGDTLYINIMGSDTVKLGEIANYTYASSSDLIEWEWSAEEGDTCINCEVFSFTPTYSQWVQLTGMDNKGCQTRSLKYILVENKKAVYIPNSFSPNDDANNDFFVVFADPSVRSILSYKIFDRWGELIYTNADLSPNLSNGYWDGRFRGKMLNPAVFAYLIEVEYIDGLRQVFTGDVTLMR